jgi:hypothetical protein
MKRNTNPPSKPPVIAIGALGGSGTRAVAQLFIKADVFMGDELNESLDNLLFTRLFKNPEWYRGASQKSILRRFRLFNQVMEGEQLSAYELLLLRHAMRANKTYPSSRDYVKSYFARQWKRPDPKPERWGWKEPNTQFFVAQLLHASPHLHYVHVLRHGLDMAFSANKKQLHNWGFLFGIEADTTQASNELARLQLDFWIESTKRIRQLQEQFPDRVLLVNRQELIASPREKIAQLLNFCRIAVPATTLESLAKIPRSQPSDGRYRQQSLHIFTPDQLAFVERCGFTI